MTRDDPPEAGLESSGLPASARMPVVGIGASAGGLEPIKQMLAELPVDTGLAIVLVQHLDPKHSSLLSSILGHATAMPVAEAVDGMGVEANHVYVIPPNTELTIADGTLKLIPRKTGADRTAQSISSCGPWPGNAAAVRSAWSSPARERTDRPAYRRSRRRAALPSLRIPRRRNSPACRVWPRRPPQSISSSPRR